MKRPFIIAACLFLSGCAAFPFHGSREVSGVQTADALSETWPADAEHFASQAALELSRRYPAGQTGLSLVTVQGQFGTSLENQLRGHGFAIFPSDSSSGVRVGYVLDEIIGEITPTGYLQIRTSDGTAFSMIRKLMGGLPSTASQAPALPAPVSTPEEPAQGTPVVTPPARTPEPVPAVEEASLAESPQTPVSQTPTAHKEEPSKASGDSRRMPIITAVRTVIPVKWQYSIQGTELRQKQVPYPKNIPWRKALMDMATATDSTVDINAKARLVTFTPKGTPSAPATTQSAVAAPVSSESPVVATALADAAATSKSAPATTNTPAPPATPKVEATSIFAEPVSLPEWHLSQGSLRTQLDVWASRASWQLIWNADTDLDMQASASFRGNFVAAVTQLFEDLHAAGFPLRATFYPSNNVLEVSDR